MLTLIENGEVYAPEPLGVQSVLLAGSQIVKIGAVDRNAAEALGAPLERIDAAGGAVTPGFLDPHQHLLGGSGEAGFGTQTPEIAFREIGGAGITTVVGCLGVDTTTKVMPALLAKAKGLRETGITAYIYSGGYDVPPATLTGSVMKDMLFITEVIGAGEVAIADRRSSEPSIDELVKLVRGTYVGGLLSGKAGLTHFHVGDGRQRLSCLRSLLEDHEVQPECLYPTHVERNELLMQEAVELSKSGVTVDIDTVEQDLPRWVQFFIDHGGSMAHLTVSSDAALNSPAALTAQIRCCVSKYGQPLERILPLVTSNTATVLQLSRKGRLKAGCDADILIWEKGSFELRDVIARGRVLVREGQVTVEEAFLTDTNRRMNLDGKKRIG